MLYKLDALYVLRVSSLLSPSCMAQVLMAAVCDACGYVLCVVCVVRAVINV